MPNTAPNATADNPANPTPARPLRGWARWRELEAERAARRHQIVAELLAELGRAPTQLDQIWAQNLAAMVVRAEQLEARGKDAAELRRLVNQTMRTGGLRPAPVEPQKPLSIAEMLAARGYAPPSVPPTNPALEGPDTEALPSAASKAAEEASSFNLKHRSL